MLANAAFFKNIVKKINITLWVLVLV